MGEEGFACCGGCDNEYWESRYLLTRRRCVLENQKAISIEARMRDRIRIGDYELLEKRNERYKAHSTQLDIENGLTSTKHTIEIQMRLY